MVRAGTFPNARELGSTNSAAAPVCAPWYSTAPTSTAFRFAGSGRGLPKKSVLGAELNPVLPFGMASMAGEPATGA